MVRFRRKPSREDFEEFDRLEKEFAGKGLKILHDLYTLGRYDNVMVIEAPDEKTVMNFLLRQSHIVATETLTAIPKAEARKLLA